MLSVHVLPVRIRRVTLPQETFTCTCFGRVSCQAIMEEDEEGDDFIDDNYLDHFGDTFMEDAEGGEGDQEEARDEPADDLGRTIADARRGYETEKERKNLDRMLEDHKKSLYPGCDNGLKKLGCTLDL